MSERAKLVIVEMCEDRLVISLVPSVESEAVEYFSDRLLQDLGGAVVHKLEGPGVRIWVHAINDERISMLYDDFGFLEISADQSTANCVVADIAAWLTKSVLNLEEVVKRNILRSGV